MLNVASGRFQLRLTGRVVTPTHGDSRWLICSCWQRAACVQSTCPQAITARYCFCKLHKGRQQYTLSFCFNPLRSEFPHRHLLAARLHVSAIALVSPGLDKLAQQKRDEAGGKALPGLGKRSRLELDDGEEQEPVSSISDRDDGGKGQARHYRSSRIDTPSHPGMQRMCYRSALWTQVMKVKRRCSQLFILFILQAEQVLVLPFPLVPCTVIAVAGQT